MRHLMIDFNTSLIEAGYLGEHNATELVIVKPADVIGAMYSVAFMTNGEVIHSKFFGADEDIRVPLWQQLTQDYELGVQLEAYDEHGDYLGKSAMITLLFNSSAHGTDVIADTDNPDVYSEIALNTWFRESLEDNADTLDKLTTSEDGNLLFDGKEIKGGGSSSLDIEVKTDTEDEYVLEITTDTETITTPNLKGENGKSGVYVGSGDMPEGYNVQIDPNGEADGLPDYWKTALETVVEKTMTNQNISGNKALSFAYFSDIHYQDSLNAYTKNIGFLVNELLKNCDAPIALMAGDTAMSGVSPTEEKFVSAIKSANKILDEIDSECLLRVKGNHDDVWGSSGDINYVNKLSPDKVYNLLFRKQACDFRRVFGDEGTYFYLDNIPQKTRFICLDTHCYDGEEITNGTELAMSFRFGETQIEWLANKALIVDDEDWKVVILCHVPPVMTAINNIIYGKLIEDVQNFRGVVEAYASKTTYESFDFSTKITGELLAIFSGHTHCDAIVKNDLPCPVITITSSAPLSYCDSEEERVANSDKETAIDMVTIDTENKVIYLARLGIGEDRTCSYLKLPYTNVLENVGYVEGYRISESSATGEVRENDSTDLTGFIECKQGDIIRLKNIQIPASTATQYVGFHFFSSENAKLTSFVNKNFASSYSDMGFEADENGNIIRFLIPESYKELEGLKYIRICASNIDDTSIVTVNQRIE